MNPKKEDWILAIKNTIDKYSNELIHITAHSIGCIAFVHAVKEYDLSVNGAFLVAPSDPEQPLYPTEISGFNPVPLIHLPFPSTVIASTNDAAVSLSRAEFFAGKWGSKLVKLTNAGHIDHKTGYGRWSEGRRLLNESL